MKKSFSQFFKAKSKVSPSIINKWGSIFIFLLYSSNLLNKTSTGVLDFSFDSLFISSFLIVYILCVFALSPAEIEIQVAVSTLSPVNIHTFIPAFLKLSIVVATSSCNKSSTPVTHKKSILFSNLDTTSAIFCCLFSIEVFASSYSLFHLSKSSWDIIFWLRTKVLKPLVAKFSAFSAM